jgi:hypothetical protein
MSAVLEEWTDRVAASDRSTAGCEAAVDGDPTFEVLRRAGLEYVREYGFAVAHEWSVDELMGLIYSTAVLNREVLGNHFSAFEADFARRLIAHEPVGTFRHTLHFAYELARRPDEL